MNPYQAPPDTTCAKCRARPRKRFISMAELWFALWLATLFALFIVRAGATKESERAERMKANWWEAMDRKQVAEQRYKKEIDELINSHPDNPHRQR